MQQIANVLCIGGWIDFGEVTEVVRSIELAHNLEQDSPLCAAFRATSGPDARQ